MRKIGFALLSMLIFSTAQAKVWNLVPIQMNTLEASGAIGTSSAAQSLYGSDTAQVFFRFDLSPVREESTRVNIIYLEWPIDGLRPDTLSTFLIYGVSDSGLTSGGAIPYTDPEDLLDIWEFSPIDYARNNGGLILFDLTQIGTDWFVGTRPNFGVVIKTADVDQSVLENQAAKARLVVR